MFDLKRLTGLLHLAGRNPETGQPLTLAEREAMLPAILASDKATRWPSIQAERDNRRFASMILDCIPVQDGIREAL